MRLNKKGISPLIATVLLIGFTIALAAIVITWGSGFMQKITSETEEKTSETFSCMNDLNFEIIKVVCDDNGATAGGVSKITVDNKGEGNIKGLRLRFFDINGQNIGTTDIDTAPAAAPQTPTIPSFTVKELSLFPGTSTLIPIGTTRIDTMAILTSPRGNLTCGEFMKQKLFSPAC